MTEQELRATFDEYQRTVIASLSLMYKTVFMTDPPNGVTVTGLLISLNHRVSSDYAQFRGWLGSTLTKGKIQ